MRVHILMKRSQEMGHLYGMKEENTLESSSMTKFMEKENSMILKGVIAEFIPLKMENF